jgi:hypothetical protein
VQFCLYADVYGFKSIVRRNLTDAATRLQAFTQDTNKIIDLFHSGGEVSINHHFFSDNLMILCSCPDEMDVCDIPRLWGTFLALCREIYEISIDHELLLRGCISVGAIEITSNQFLGEPVIEAVEIEKGIRLPFLFVPTPSGKIP